LLDFDSWSKALFRSTLEQGKFVETAVKICIEKKVFRLKFTIHLFIFLLVENSTVCAVFWLLQLQLSRFCYVVNDSRKFNGFNNCTLWSIIVVIALGKCAGAPPMYWPHEKWKLFKKTPFSQLNSEALNMFELNTT
jgi:hypothetical protein